MKYLFFILLLILFLLVQTYPAFGRGGFFPNFLFGYFIVLSLFAERFDLEKWFFAALFAVVTGIVAFLVPVWLIPVLTLLGYSLIFFAVRKFLTGNPFFDAPAGAFIGVLLFYASRHITSLGIIPWKQVFFEAFATALLGVVLVFFADRLSDRRLFPAR